MWMTPYSPIMYQGLQNTSSGAAGINATANVTATVAAAGVVSNISEAFQTTGDIMALSFNYLIQFTLILLVIPAVVWFIFSVIKGIINGVTTPGHASEAAQEMLEAVREGNREVPSDFVATDQTPDGIVNFTHKNNIEPQKEQVIVQEKKQARGAYLEWKESK